MEILRIKKIMMEPSWGSRIGDVCKEAYNFVSDSDCGSPNIEFMFNGIQITMKNLREEARCISSQK
jgi:hypothetical protein